MIQNIPKHEFWIQWSGSGVRVVKNSAATSFSELVRQWHMFGQFWKNFHGATKRSEMPQNMSFGSNGLDQVRLLRKIPTQLCLANLCVNGTCSASFATTFVQ
jgi:hypothetical protein